MTERLNNNGDKPENGSVGQGVKVPGKSKVRRDRVALDEF